MVWTENSFLWTIASFKSFIQVLSVFHTYRLLQFEDQRKKRMKRTAEDLVMVYLEETPNSQVV